MAAHVDAYCSGDFPGAAIVEAAGRWVILDGADWERLAALGPLLWWFVGKSGGQPVPMLKHPNFGVMIAARVIVSAGEREIVGYRNGDAFDLRRANLVVTRKWASHRRRIPLPVLD